MATTYLDPIHRNMVFKDPGEARTPEQSGVETMFSVRQATWHKLGIVVPEAFKLADTKSILEAAGLGFTVSKRPLRAARTIGDNGDFDDFVLGTSEYFAMVRDDTNEILGVVGRRYEPFQNWQALDLLNDILASGEATAETAGVLDGGKRVWILANIPRDLTVADDIHIPYLLVSTTHDGSGSARADLTLERVQCRNTVKFAIRNTELRERLAELGIDNFTSSWTHKHSRNVSSKAAEARRILGFANEFIDAYAAEIDSLVARVVPAAEFDDLLVVEFPLATGATERQERNTLDRRDRVRAAYENPQDGGLFKGTAWGVVNAFNSFDLWADPIRDEAKRPARQMARLLDGSVEKRINRVRDRLDA